MNKTTHKTILIILSFALALIVSIPVASAGLREIFTGGAIATTTDSKTSACKDTDGGIVYDKATTVVYDYGRKRVSDYCTENGVLVERYCNGADVLSKKYACPGVCVDGACIQEKTEPTPVPEPIQTSCKDSDEGYAYYTKGSAKDTSGGYADDTCLVSNQYGGADFVLSCTGKNCMVEEAACYSGEYSPNPIVTRKDFTCPNGCENGACLPEKQESSCKDTDGGINYYEYGELYRNNQLVARDICSKIDAVCPTAGCAEENYGSTGKYLIEQEFNKNCEQEQSVVTCDTGCKEGMCAPSVTPAPPQPVPFISINMFYDPQDPYTARFMQETYPAIEYDYISQGTATFELYPFPLSFHENAKPASIAVECARLQGYALPYLQFILNEQNKWKDVANPKGYLEKAARNIDISDFQKFRTCLRNEETASLVDTYTEKGRSMGVSGTPTFFINGVMVVGALPTDEFISKMKEIATPTETPPEPRTLPKDSCKQKMEGKGVCEAYREGYEFDASEGACVKKGLSGCSFIVPFNTLEECQSACGTDKRVVPPSIPPSKKERCDGCMLNARCIPFGTRMESDGVAQYCDISGEFGKQRTASASCQNNYECGSNLCVDNSCIEQGMFNKIILWFQKLFGGKQ